MNEFSLYEQALYEAASNGDLQSINALLFNGLVDLQSLRNTDLDPIYAAVRNKQSHVIDFFRESGSIIDPNDFNFLSIACRKGHEDMVHLLLSKLYSKDLCHRLSSVLEIAVKENQESIVRVLVSYRAFPTKDEEINYHIIVHCLSTFKDYLIINALIRRIPDVNYSLDGKSLLELVVEKNSLLLATSLLKRGAKTNPRIFYEAMNQGNTGMLKLLLKNSNGQHVRWLFFKSCELGDLKCIQALICCGVDPNIINKKQENALFHCYMHFKVIEFLLEWKVDPNQMDTRGMTPLHLAVSHNCKDSAMILIENGADVNQQDRNGVSPVHLACQITDGQILSLLLLMSEDLDLNDHKDNVGRGLLFYARSCEVWELLLHNGVSFRDVELPRCTHGSNIVLCKKFSFFKKMHLLGFELEVLQDEYRHIDKEILEEYRLEIKAMKVVDISYWPKRTLFDLLFDKRGKISKFLRQNEFNALKHKCEEDFEIKYPHFGFAYNLMLKRQLLISRAFVELSCMVGTFISKTCTDNIFSYLNDTDLRVFVDDF